MPTLLELPLEVLTLILGHLQIVSLLNFCATCHSVRATFRSDLLSQVLNNDDVSKRKKLAAEMSPIMRHQALVYLFGLHEERELDHDHEWLLDLGASFAPVPHGELLKSTFLKNGAESSSIEFMLSHGASFDAIPGGINMLLEDSLRQNDIEVSAQWLLDRGAKMSDVPSGIENLIDDLLMEMSADSEVYWDPLEFILRNHGPLTYVSKTLKSMLFEEAQGAGDHEEFESVAGYIPNFKQLMLEESVRYGEVLCLSDVLDEGEASLRLFMIDGITLQARLEEGTRLEDSPQVATVMYGAGLQCDQELLEEMLAQGAPVDAVEPNYGRTALHGAMTLENDQVAKYLLAQGANPSHQDKDGCTPLHYIAYRRDLNILDHLASKGADLNAQRKSTGTTALIDAIRAKSIKLASALLALGADPLIADHNGWAAIHYAAASRDTRILEMLLKAGQDCDYVAPGVTRGIQSDVDTEMTPIIAAASKGCFEAIKILVQAGANVRKASSDGSTALHLAAEEDWGEIIAYLVAQGAPIDALNDEGYSPLHVAALEDHETAVGLLIDLGAAIELAPPDEPFATPLYLAAGANNLNAASCLIDEGAKVVPQNEETTTPIFVAVRNNHPEMARLLIQRGARTDLANADGFFPLHIAAVSGHSRVATVLLEEGAAVDCTETTGATPLLLAVAGNHLRCVHELVAGGADPNRRGDDSSLIAILCAAMKGDVDMMKLLVENKADLNVKGARGLTALYLSSQSGKLEIVRYLVQKGADINSMTDDERTPVHSAASSGDVEVVKYLVREGAAHNKRDLWGTTPLLDACSNGRLNVVQYLLTLPNVSPKGDKDDFGRTALLWALHEHHLDVAKLLISFDCDLLTDIDGYGRTAYDWMVLFGVSQKLQLPGNRQQTSDAERKSVLRKSVRQLSERLLTSNDRECELGFHELGHCLMYLDDVDSARFCYQQQILGIAEDETITGKITHDVRCEACKKAGSDFCGRRYICTICPNTDLCEECHDDYVLCHDLISTLTTGSCVEDIGPEAPDAVRETLQRFAHCRHLLTMCPNHEYLQIDSPSPDFRPENIGPEIPVAVREALEGFMKIYSD